MIRHDISAASAMVAQLRSSVAQAAAWCRWHGPEARPTYDRRRAALRRAEATLARLEAALHAVPEPQCVDLHRYPHLDNAPPRGWTHVDVVLIQPETVSVDVAHPIYSPAPIVVDRVGYAVERIVEGTLAVLALATPILTFLPTF